MLTSLPLLLGSQFRNRNLQYGYNKIEDQKELSLMYDAHSKVVNLMEISLF